MAQLATRNKFLPLFTAEIFMIIKRNKALSVSPLKASQPMGATLAFLGIYKAMPMLHGSQGCTAFGKVFFVRHFREPIPLQTTALDQVSTIMNPDANVIEGLRVIAEKSRPDIIGLITTGLSETEGTDIKRVVREFRQAYPQYDSMAIIAVNTPDYKGCLETGYSLAVQTMLEELVPFTASQPQTGQRKNQVNLIVGSSLTPGDVEILKETVTAFGLRPVLVPDLGDAMDGHLTEQRLNSLTTGGLAVSEFASLGSAKATISIGSSMLPAANILETRTTVPHYHFASLMSMSDFDKFLMTLRDISGSAVPEHFARQRSQLQDAMLDTHFMLGQLRVAMAGDADELYNFAQLLTSVGAELVAVVASHNAKILDQIPTKQIKIGDLEDLEQEAIQQQAQLFIGNSHVAEVAKRCNIPVLRAGYPQYDYVGGYQRSWIGYRACRQSLFDLANLVLQNHQHEIQPYRAKFSQKMDYELTDSI